MTYIFFYFSIWWMVGGLVANRWLLKKFSPTKTAVLPLFLVPLFIFSFLIFKDLSWIWFASGMANFFQAITISCFFALFSTLATKEIQGKAFGLWNAGFALTSALSPFHRTPGPLLSNLSSIYPCSSRPIWMRTILFALAIT